MATAWEAGWKCDALCAAEIDCRAYTFVAKGHSRPPPGKDKHIPSICQEDHWHHGIRMYFDNFPTDVHVCTVFKGSCLYGMEHFPTTATITLLSRSFITC